MRRLCIVSFVAFFSVASLADSSGWETNISFRYSSQSSLKVVGEDGLSVLVEHDGKRRSDTTPAIFQFSDGDRYVRVTVSKGKQTWSKKVEIRGRTQTTLEIRPTHKAKKKQARRKNRKYLVVFKNSTDKCGSLFMERDVRFQLLHKGKQVFESRTLDDGSSEKTEVWGGKYDVRYYVEKDGRPQFKFSRELKVERDGIVVDYKECYKD